MVLMKRADGFSYVALSYRNFYLFITYFEQTANLVVIHSCACAIAPSTVSDAVERRQTLNAIMVTCYFPIHAFPQISRLVRRGY